MKDQFASATCSKILEHLELGLQRVDPAPDEAAVELNRQYCRWEIASLVARKPMTADETQQLKKDVTECFSKFTEQLKKEYPAALQAEVAQNAATYLDITLKSMDDPLFPGLKKPIQKEQYQAILQMATDFWKQQKTMFDNYVARAAAFQANNPAGAAELEAVKKAPIKEAFMMLLGGMQDFGVEYDEPLKQAVQKWSAIRQEEFKKRSAESRKKREEKSKATIDEGD